MSLIGALTKAGKAGEAVKKTAPFYSAVDEALSNLKRPKGTGIEFLTEVMKTKGVKKAEIADRKLEEAFKAKGKMTKEEAQQVLADNPPPKLQERVLEDLTERERQEMLQDMMERYGYDNYRDVPNSRMREFQEEIDSGAVKYNEPDYKTQGGSNYREILLKLPKSRPDANDYKDPAKYDADVRAYNASGKDDYLSQHWDDKNVLAHMRVQDRLIDQPPQKGFYVVNKTSGRQSAMFDTPEELQAYVETLPESIRNNVTMAQGERKVPPRKVLQVEEIQSDWHQEGRKKGYATGKEEQDYVDYLSNLELRAKNEAKQDFISEGVAEDKAEVMASRLAKRLAENPIHLADYFGGDVRAKQMELNKARVDARNGIPDAPFKKNWHELAMKRLLNYAADNGYDSIAITPGSEHFKRYGSERIDWKKGDDGWTVGAKEQFGGRHGGQDIEDLARDRGILLEKQGDTVKTKDDLHRIVNTVLNRENNPEQVNKLTNRIWDRMQTEPEGTSLPRKEGMEGFYDKILTDYLNSYGRDYGAQVSRLELPTGEKMVPDNAGLGMIRSGEQNMLGYHNFPITPEMRESIKQKGLPLYQQVGIPTAGAASQALQPEEEAGLATGGVVKSAVKQAQLAKLAKMRQEMAPRAEAVKALIARDQNRYLGDVVPNSLTNPEIEAEIARMAARAKASGQQEGVLPRSERDANLSKMLEGSAAKKRLYHATDKDIVSYDKSKLGTNPDTAHQTSQLGFFLTDSTDEASGYAGKRKGANIQPVYANIKNPYVTTWDNIHEVDGSELQQKLKGLGYDGVLIKDKGMPDNYVAFEPTQIKSAIGNRGTYDINEPEVNKAKGGRVRMTTNRDTMFMELSNKKLKRK